MGGKGGQDTVTQTSSPVIPGWLNQGAQNYEQALQGLTFNSPYSYLSYNPLQNPATAPFSDAQLQGMNQLLGANPAYSQAINMGLGAIQNMLSGGGGANIPQLPPVPQGGGNYGSVNLGGISGVGGGIQAPNVNVPLRDITTPSGQSIAGNVNPYLGDYYKSAADEMTKLYKYSTAPSQMSAAALQGAFGGSADATQRMMSEFGLGQNLANLGAQIYEPAWAQQQQLGYQYEQLGANTQLQQQQMQLQQALQNAQMSLQAQLAAQQINAQTKMLASQLQAQAAMQGQALSAQQAMQAASLQVQQNIASQNAALQGQQIQAQTQLGALGMLPGLAQSLYTPAQMSLGVGGMQQQQLQNILNGVTSGANQMQQYPYNVLNQYGAGIQSLLGPYSGAIQTSPNPQAMGSKF